MSSFFGTKKNECESTAARQRPKHITCNILDNIPYTMPWIRVKPLWELLSAKWEIQRPKREFWSESSGKPF